MNRILLSLLAVALCLGSPLNILMAADFYVTAQGAPSGGDGSLASPFGTITEALNSGSLVAGDVLHLAPGAYTYGRGETFPLDMIDGLHLMGYGPQNTIISAIGASDYMFEIDDYVNPTIISGVSLKGDSTTFYLSGSIAHLQLSDCIWMGQPSGDPLMDYSDTSGGPVNIWVSNCVFGDFEEDVFYWDAYGTGTHCIQVRDCDIASTDSGLFNLDVSGGPDITFKATGNRFGYFDHTAVEINVDNSADVTLQFLDNLWLGMGSQQFDVSWQVSFTGQEQNFNFRLEGNLFEGNDSYCVETSANLDESSCELNINWQILDNCWFANSCTILSCDLSANASNATIHYTGLISGNSFVNNYSDPMSLSWFAQSNGVVNCDLIIACNNVVGNSSYPMSLEWTARSSGEINIDRALIYQNVFVGGESPIQVYLTSTASAPVNGQPNFGSALMPGKNTIRANSTQASVSSGLDLELFAQSTGITVSAISNWWEGSGLALIETRINHDGGGDTGTGHVDFSNPLPFDLSFVLAGGGQQGGLAILTATNNSCFVQKAGKTDICVIVDGIQADTATVGNDGGSVSFPVPFGVSPGAVTVLVKNPGGQIGSIVAAFAAAGGGSGRCFVATAAYGDDEAPEVMVLRKWRDEHLSENALGRQLVKAYYAVSPGLAEAISESDTARAISRAALTPVVGAVQLWMHMPWAYALVAAVLGWRVLRKRS